MKATEKTALPKSSSAARRGFRLAGLLVAAAICWAPGYTQNNAPAQPPAGAKPPEGAKPADPPKPGGPQIRLRRLESVTWNPVTEELTWVVSTADPASDVYKPGVKQTYVIHMDQATMNFNGSARRFDRHEAEQVYALLDVLSRYTVESTIWWEHGEGERVEPNAPPSGGATREKEDQDKNKDNQDNKNKEDKSNPRKVAPLVGHGSNAASFTAANQSPARQ